MVKKEASKGREWEKGRRDVLNQTFNELHQALPSYVVGQTLSKKTILIQALACIRELQQTRKGDAADDQVFKSDHYKKWVQNILTKFNHLLSFLNTINIKVPEDCLSIDAPPPGIGPDILQLLSKHEKARLSIGISSQENKSHGAQNADEVKKSDLSNDLYSASSSSHCTGSSPKKKVYSSSQCGKASQSENLINESSESLIANPSVVQSRPLVVQSSSIQMPSQLLFTSNSSNSPLPLLVSVTGVKTVNPFILVQSNIMAPNPSAPQKLMRSGSSRPIQPCPTSKISRKPPKIPIPSLKQKLLLSGFSHPHSTQLKCLKKNLRRNSSKSSPEIKSEKAIRKNKVQKVKRPSNSTNATSMLVVSKSKKNSTCDMHVSNKTEQTVDGKPVGTVSDVNKENIVQCDPSSNANVDESTGSAFALKDTPLPAENGGSVAGDMRVHSVPVCIIESPSENQETSAISTGKEGNNILKKMTYESEDINCSKSKKCENKASQVKSSLEHGESHASKPTKSNYSISALCARQQLLQNTENTVLTEEPQETSNSKSSETQKAKLPSNPNIESNNVPMVTSARNLTDNCSIVKDKATELASNDVCNEWSDKSKLKPDRPSTSFNIFSSLPLHNSKNTFIPINDIESFKPVPESFDSTDNSFGLPLQSNDISNDLFASLQVPSGGQHPESISPTAAFLLAFPLVSTSKATELDDTVCENTDSQPGMKTLLQIGNLDCDTPVTKCVSVFSSIENSNVVYSSSNVFNQDSLTVSAIKNRNSTADVLNFPAREATQKSNNENMIPLKESPNFGQKCPESSLSIEESVPFSSKEHYQAGCSSNNKRICASRTESSTILTVSNINGQLNGTRVSTRNGTLLQESGPSKSPQKLIHPQENGGSITFLGCEKQSDWLEMPQAPLTIFPDYPPTSTSRSDCAVNYVLPPVLMSSSAGGEELLALSRSQGSSSIPSSILSWSTMSSGNIQSSTSTSKVVNFQEMFPVTKALNKTIELQHLVHNQNVSSSSSQTQLITTSATTLSHKLNSVLSNYSEVLSSSSKISNALTGKQITHTQNFAPPENITEARKPFLSVTATKDLICNSSEVPKMSSNFCGSTTHLQTRTEATQSSSTKMMYLSSENKLSKANNVYFEEKVASQNVKIGMSASLNSSSKDSSSLLTYNQNNVVVAVPEVKQIHSNYSHIPTLNVKGAAGQNNIVGNNYNHQNNTLPKQSPGSGSHYSTGISSVADPKKDVSTFTHNSGASVEVLKQTSSLHYNQENTSMLQFGSNSTNLPSSHQGSYNSKPNNQNGQEDKSQPGQQRQLCVRANNKESVTNLHRPPVNWMTAPDIRSHQHHSGPSFGNSSNMNSTQGLLYLPEHIKESENIGPVFDQTANFHCLDMAHSSQPLYKGNEHHLFGNDSIENFHDNSAWSPSKSGGSSMLGNMMIPSTLPTLVGDLALGDNSISRPFLPTFNNDSQGCPKKPARRMINAPRRSDKCIDEASVTTATIGGQECAGSFLSVSQLVDTSNVAKSRTTTIPKESHLSYTGPFSDHDTVSCQTSKQSTSKSVSSNYSTEALLSSTIPLQTSQTNNRKRRSHGTHYSNNYAGTSMPYQNTSSVSLQAQGPQNQYLSDLPRSNDYQGTFISSDTVPPFILGNPTSRSHRNHSYSLQNVTDRTSVEDNSNPLKSHHPGGMLDNSTGRPRTNNHNSTSNGTSTVAVSSSSNIMDFGYMNMTSTVLQDDINFTNHPPPPPSFLPHHSYSMPAAQDSLYSTPRLSMHPTHHPQNSNIQSPSATTLTNFHLSTIFPEINDKVIC
ncbi:uncharacterized protein LOC113202808 [Frankliniella occidentalis]|uniref:Uncharacterized protein LOC113202808 n=1 Tax=Frankliniella occidentalis TaxID=133901 RepID=A0A6J1S2F9_FRAOC|nr:uncharacterized protein LOC113202808 [Frankliniella occidentalis]